MELYSYWQVLADRKKEAATSREKKEAAHYVAGVWGEGRQKDLFSAKNTLTLEASLTVPTFIRKGIIIKV